MQIIAPETLDLMRMLAYATVSIHVDGLEGELTLESSDLTEQSLELTRSAVDSNTIGIGTAIATELKFVLNNYDGQFNDFKFEGAVLTPVLTVGDEQIPLGKYIVDQRPKRLATLEIIALDYMAKFARPYESVMPYPATLEQILNDACAECNVTLGTTSFLHDDYVVDVRPEEVTYQQLVMSVAELAGACAWVNHDGELILSWYGDAGSFEISAADRFGGFSMAESDVQITGIRYEDEDYLIGADDYVLVIEDNPLLQNGWQDVVDAVYAKVGGFRYRPWTSTCKGYPHLWPMDSITLTDPDGIEHETILTSHQFFVNGLSQLGAIGETETMRGYATAAPLTAKQKRIVKREAAIVTTERMSPYIEALLGANAMTASNMGLWQTLDSDPVGGTIIYWHDAATLDGSTYIEMQSAAGHWWTNDGWQDGEPIWTAGYSHTGDAIFRFLAAVGISTSWLRGDYIEGTDGKVRINLLDGRVETVGADGSVEQEGNVIRVKARDPDTGVHVATIEITADATPGDDNAHLRISLASPDGTVSSVIEQAFDYDENTGEPSAIGKLRIQSAAGVQIDHTLDILSSIYLGNMQVRKTTEAGNQGIDFIWTGV